MPMTLSGDGTITGLAVGGLPDGSIAEGDIATGAVTQTKIATGVAGTGPLFSASKTGADQVIATSTTTKVTFETADVDTASCFSSSTFTPNVAGYYQFIFMAQSEIVSSGRVVTWISKSGTRLNLREENLNGPAVTYPSRFMSAILYANGTTDYFEIYVRQESGSNKFVYTSANGTYFQGYLVRAA
jgi:hypothetical protein